MFDFLRIAGLASLALGAAGASGQVLPLTVTEPLPPVTEAVALPQTPAVLPFATLPATRSDVTDTVVPDAESLPPLATSTLAASSLSELVLRHAQSETADDAQQCLAGAIYFESKGEPLDGQLAVAKVIMNRAASGRFARSVCGVVHQRGQFSFVRGGSMPPVARNSANWRTAVAVAHIAANELWKPTADNALYFHARRISPGWRMTRVATIGNHVFYR